MTTSKDLFDDSTMTFGEHLEVLRFYLIRALLGLMVSVLFSLIFGEQLVRLIRQPIDAALRRANVISAVQDDVKGFNLWNWITSGVKGQIIPPSVREEDKAQLRVLSEDEKRELKIDVSAYDLIAELQGRLPIRVELSALTAEDFVRILTEPNASLTEQYIALMSTEGVELRFDETGIRRIAEVAWQVNESTENIGARRLYTVMERLLEVISFEATDKSGQSVHVDTEYVQAHLGQLLANEDLTRYIL